MSYESNYRKIIEDIENVSTKANRSDSVSLAAVSKTVDAEAIKKVYSCGQRIFAENRAQVLRDKCKTLKDLDIEWHFIGPLQKNKIKYVYPVARLVHSIDSVELIEQFILWAEKTGRKCPILLEVHISNETSKQGFSSDEILDVIQKYKDNANLDIRGLMGMAPFVDDEVEVRNSFRLLHSLLVKSKALEGKAYRAEHLSMGMTNDYKIAIEEGATIVRIGSAIFANV